MEVFHPLSIYTYRLDYWLTALVLGGFCAWQAMKFASGRLSKAGLALAGLVLGGALAFVLRRAWIHAAVVSATGTPAARAQFGSHRLTIGPDGVAEDGPAGTHTHAWSAIEGLWETPDQFFLAVGGGYAYVVPKSHLSESSAAEFRAAVTQELAEEGRRRTRG